MTRPARYEYRTVTVRTDQSWAGARGTIDTELLDEELNEYARDGWRLHLMETLEHASGTNLLVCIFERPLS